MLGSVNFRLEEEIAKAAHILRAMLAAGAAAAARVGARAGARLRCVPARREARHRALGALRHGARRRARRRGGRLVGAVGDRHGRPEHGAAGRRAARRVPHRAQLGRGGLGVRGRRRASLGPQVGAVVGPVGGTREVTGAVRARGARRRRRAALAPPYFTCLHRPPCGWALPRLRRRPSTSATRSTSASTASPACARADQLRGEVAPPAAADPLFAALRAAGQPGGAEPPPVPPARRRCPWRMRSRRPRARARARTATPSLQAEPIRGAREAYPAACRLGREIEDRGRVHAFCARSVAGGDHRGPAKNAAPPRPRRRREPRTSAPFRFEVARVAAVSDPRARGSPLVARAAAAWRARASQAARGATQSPEHAWRGACQRRRGDGEPADQGPRCRRTSRARAASSSPFASPCRAALAHERLPIEWRTSACTSRAAARGSRPRSQSASATTTAQRARPAAEHALPQRPAASVPAFRERTRAAASTSRRARAVDVVARRRRGAARAWRAARATTTEARRSGGSAPRARRRRARIGQRGAARRAAAASVAAARRRRAFDRGSGPASATLRRREASPGAERARPRLISGAPRRGAIAASWRAVLGSARPRVVVVEKLRGACGVPLGCRPASRSPRRRPTAARVRSAANRTIGAAPGASPAGGAAGSGVEPSGLSTTTRMPRERTARPPPAAGPRPTRARARDELALSAARGHDHRDQRARLASRQVIAPRRWVCLHGRQK